jgi:transposase InsO family protein
VHTPEQNCHIESFHKTLKKEYLLANDFASYQEAEEVIGMAHLDYNHFRIHSALTRLASCTQAKLWEMTNK